jgi:hypothetical protein
MPYGTVNTDILQGTLGGIISPDSSVFRNRIINGAMVIAQRGTGTTSTAFLNQVDQFQVATNYASSWTFGQSSTTSTGFIKSALVTNSAVNTASTSQYYSVRNVIEGLNIADLGWGAANAKTVTLSFWVRSSLTGSFGGSIFNGSANYSYPFLYTINSANTFEYKTITIAGPTAGTWATDNGTGMFIEWSLGCGSNYLGTAGAWAASRFQGATGQVQLSQTNGATFYLTGVQLEAGSTASSFEYRSYGQELALCQRYLPVINLADSVGGFTSLVSGYAAGSTSFYCTFPYKVNVRTPATGISVTNPTTAFGVAWGLTSAVSAITYSGSTYETGTFYASVTGATLGNGGALYALTSNGKILFTGCEL